MPEPASQSSRQSTVERDLVKDVLASVGFLFAPDLPEWLYESLTDAPDDTVDRVVSLIELRRASV